MAQALILATACLESESLDAEDLGRRFWTWAEENGLGIGLLTADVLSRYDGANPRSAWDMATARASRQDAPPWMRPVPCGRNPADRPPANRRR